MATTEKKPRDYLMEMKVGPDGAILVSPDVANAFRIAASNLKMQGLRFKTRAIMPNADPAFPGQCGLKIVRVK